MIWIFIAQNDVFKEFEIDEMSDLGKYANYFYKPFLIITV